MRRCRLQLCTSVAALTLLGALPAARADRADRRDDVSAYQQEVARASAAFDAGNYATARNSFRAAYAIHPEPVLLFNIASTYRREGALDKAIVEYRAFLAIATEDDPRRVLATQTVIDLEDQLALQERGPQPTEIIPDVDAELDDETPDPPMIDREPEPAEPDRTPTRTRRPGAALRWTGLALGAGAVIAGGFAVAAGLEVERNEDALEGRVAGAPWNFEAERRFAQGESAQRNMLLWSVATVALATTGVVLYVTGDRQRDRAASLTLVPSSDGASLSLSGGF